MRRGFRVTQILVLPNPRLMRLARCAAWVVRASDPMKMLPVFQLSCQNRLAPIYRVDLFPVFSRIFSCQLSRNISRQWIIRNRVSYCNISTIRKEQHWMKESNVRTKMCSSIGVQFLKWKNLFIKYDITRYINPASGGFKTFIPFVHIPVP
jgi:hypothetical protein